jgi:putative ABC transport system permease protein
LTEGLLLALAGAGTGALFAAGAVRVFRKLGPVALPVHAGEVGVDVPVLLFAVVLSIGTTLAFALLPAIGVSRVDLSQSLKLSGRGSFGITRRRAAQMMVATQITISFILLAGANLLMSSVLRLGSEQLGFDTDGVVAVHVTLPQARYPKPGDRERFRTALLERLETTPGVKSAALGFAPPWDPHDNIVESRLEIQGRPASADAPLIERSSAGPGLFEILKTPLLRGRFFDSRDQMTAIVSQKLVADYFAGQNPIGLRIRTDDKDSPWMTIVGVVGNWKHMVNDAIWRDTPMVFWPVARDPAGPTIDITVRAVGDPRLLRREIQKQVAALDSSVETKEPELLSDRLSKSLLYPRFRAVLLACFGLSALLLAAVGLHGVLAQLVAQRIPEFGVRRAVGAQTRDLIALVGKQGGTPVLAGLGAGIAAALTLGQVLQSMLYGIRPADPGVFLWTTLSLLAAAILAMALPARRAASVDPMVALREE